jgi:DNA-binding response OmpR family regulator
MSTLLLAADAGHEAGAKLEQHLRHDGFEIVSERASFVGDRRPDLVLAADPADLERWRGEAPVIVLGSAEADRIDVVRAFRRGCDDYLAQPFHYDELVERIRAVLRRTQPPAGERLAAGPIEIDLAARLVHAGGRQVELSQKEFALLVRLAGEPNRVFTKKELLRDVWGYPAHARTRTLDSHASRLRRKLRHADSATPYIENVWGVGYRLLGVHP